MTKIINTAAMKLLLESTLVGHSE